METEVNEFIGLPYKYNNGPAALIGQPDTLSGGLNCQSLVHLIYQKFGLRLPIEMLSKEIFEDTELFENVDGLEQLKMLDLFVFGRQNEHNFRRLHLAVFTGEINESGSPLLVHANGIEKQVSVWALENFFLYPRYQRIYAIKRWRE